MWQWILPGLPNNPRDLVFVTSDMIMNYYDVVYDYVEDYH